MDSSHEPRTHEAGKSQVAARVSLIASFPREGYNKKIVKQRAAGASAIIFFHQYSSLVRRTLHSSKEA